MDQNRRAQRRGMLFRVILPAALLGTGMGVGGWMIASNWNAQAATRAPAAKARPAPGATKYDRVLGNIYYRVPPGYRAVQTGGGVYMVRASEVDAGNVTGGLLITPGLPFNAELKQKLQSVSKKEFVQAMALLLTGLADDAETTKMTDPQLGNDPAKDGYEGYTVIVESKATEAGQTRHMQVAVVLSGDRIEGFMRLAYGEITNLEALTPGFQALASSIEFRNTGAPPPTRLAAALSTNLAAIRPKAPAAQSASGAITSTAKPGKGRPKSCAVYYRQQCNFTGVGAFQNYNCFTVPATPAGCP